MQFCKLLSLSMILGSALYAWSGESVDGCVNRGKKLFSHKQYTQAKEKFTQCVQLDAKNLEAQLSLGGALLTLDELDGAEKAFKDALAVMPRNSAYRSYTYSMLGDIALKRQQNEQAMSWYTQSLESNVANVNSLIGKGIIMEYQGNKRGAAEFYRSALAVEPLNLIARQRLINLEPDYLSDADMLAALKQRYAVKPDAAQLTPENRQLFADIHKAEQRRGIEYFKNKYNRVPSDYVVVLNKGTEFERELLTLAGYRELTTQIGQDAVTVFQRAGVPIQEVFALRNLKGEKVFTPESTLTDAGYVVYTDALENRKTFVRPSEDLPLTAAALKRMEQEVANLKKAGYYEISPRELKYIQTETNCNEDTLRKSLGLYLFKVSKNKRRYFVFGGDSSKDAKKGVAHYYAQKYEQRQNKAIKLPTNYFVESVSHYGYKVCMDNGTLGL